MKVSGFSFIRNAIRYDYPLEEAVKSVLPLCDVFYLAVGRSEDETLELARSIDPKVHIIETEWDDTLREGGKVLAVETNKAFRAIQGDSTWCFYIQADEVIHEKYLDTIRSAMEKWKEDPGVDGLLLNYLHFFGSYDYVATAPNWYRKEIRIIRNDRSIYSYRDAQGFRKGNNKKLCVKPVDAYVYHYGWVKHPEVQIQKHRDFHKLYHPGEWKDTRMYKANEFDYSVIDVVARFQESHPRVMLPRIKARNWSFDRDLSLNKMKFRNRLKRFVEKNFGFIPGEYRNYRIV